MNDLQTHVTNYLGYCQNQKRLDAKTLRAYRIDLSQFCSHVQTCHFPDYDSYSNEYIGETKVSDDCWEKYIPFRQKLFTKGQYSNTC